MGAKYKIQFGVEGIRQAVQGINEIRNAQQARANTANDLRKLAQIEANERRVAEEALPPKKRLAMLDKERKRNTERLATAQKKLNDLQSRGAKTTFVSAYIAKLKLANKEVDRQIAKVRQLQSGGGFMGKLRGGLGGMLGAVGLGSMAGVGYAGRQVVGEMGKLNKQSGTIGVDAEFLQSFQFAAGQFSIASDQSAMGLQRFARRLAQAQEGNGELLPQLEKMGIALTDIDGNSRSTTAVLRDYADGIKQIQDPQAKLLAGFKAFDSEGAALVNVLNGGAAGLDKMIQAAKDSGTVIENDVVKRLAAADSRLELFGRQVKVWSANAIDPLLTFFTEVSDGISDLIKAGKIELNFISDFLANLLTGDGFGAAARSADVIRQQNIQLLANHQNNRAARRAAELAAMAVQPAGVLAAAPELGEAIGNVVAKKIEKVTKSVDALARIGGSRGPGAALSEQARRMADLNRNQMQANQSLQRIDRNTRVLV